MATSDIVVPYVNRVPLWLKLIFTAFMFVLVPVYWYYYGPTNFLYFCDVSLLLTLHRSVTASELRVTQKRQDIAWLQSMAPQLAGRRPPAARGNESLVSLTARVAQQSGIVKSMAGSQASGNGGLRVRMEKVSFDALALWLGQLSDQYQVGIESATIDAADAAGLVNATIVLRRT